MPDALGGAASASTRCGPSSRPSAGTRRPAATAGSPGPARTTTCGSGSPGECAARGLDLTGTGPATSGPGGATPTPRADGRPRRRRRLAPGLGARRRGLRRPARGRLGARGGRPAARRRLRPEFRWPSPVSATRRAPGSASPVPDRASSPERSRPTAPSASPTPTARRWPRRSRLPAATRRRLGRDHETLARVGTPSSSCTSSRAARSPTPTPTTRAFRGGCRQRHLAARPLADRRSGHGQPRRHDPRSRTATTRCSSTPPSSSPPAAAATRHGCVATVGKVRVEPGGVNAIASHVAIWLDARGADEAAVRRVVADLEGAAAPHGATLTRGVVDPDDPVRRRPRPAPGDLRSGPTRRVLGTGAGHDAGILATQGIPSAMLFVRNPTGVSHSPAEHADQADCHAGVAALTAVLTDLTRGGTVTTYWAEHAWLPTGPATSVRLTVHGRPVRPDPDRTRTPTTTTSACPASSSPGLANTHSHAFHRALRGRTHGGSGNFWTWREQMYAVTQRLNPDTYFALARATFAEMALAGITVVGEFHYLHHGPSGRPYADPNAMGDAADRGGGRGRHPDHAARHLLPRRRPDRRGAHRARRRPAAVLRRLVGGLARPDVAAHPAARRHRPGRCRRPLGPGRAQAVARGGRRLGRGPADPRAPLRAARREHRLRDVLRLLADRSSSPTRACCDPT